MGTLSEDRDRGRVPALQAALAAALLGAVTLLFFWPGVAHYDTVAQYQQVVSGAYYDWHPPAMARLWSGFHALGWAGQQPMFVFQTLLYWTGLGLIATALADAGKRVAAASVLALGLWPPVLGWEAVVVKDVQMAAALLAATGLVAWKRSQGTRLGIAGTIAVLVLLGYAVLVRSNAIFAVAPLAVGLFAPWQWHAWRSQFLLMGAGTLAVLALAPTINHGLFGAEPSGVEATQPIFDLAGIAHRAGPEEVPLLPPQTWRQLEARRCYSSVLWDIFSIGKRCDFIQHGLTGKPRQEIFAAWTSAIREHPGAYSSHRISHWNATMRWFVPWDFPQAVPPAESFTNDLGLRSPGDHLAAYSGFAGWLANSPLGAPILALSLAVGVLVLARPVRSAAHRLAVPLALSATTMELSFLVVSIANDWRYHLWSVLAAGLSAILLLTEPLQRQSARIAVAAVALVALTALGARLALLSIGNDYEALIR